MGNFNDQGLFSSKGSSQTSLLRVSYSGQKNNLSHHQLLKVIIDTMLAAFLLLFLFHYTHSTDTSEKSHLYSEEKSSNGKVSGAPVVNTTASNPTNPTRPAGTEKDLLEDLLSKSKALVRPVVDKSYPIIVTFGFTLVQIIELNEHEQSVTMKIWLRMRWFNEFMKWDPKMWGNIFHSRVHPYDVWTPDIFLEEDVGQEVASGVANHKTPILIYSTGEQVWMVPVMLVSACAMDVEKFPFDQQNCRLKFTPWTHDKTELDIELESKSITTQHYVESQEWSLISVKLLI